MPASKFKFVSPGVFVKEIDESQIPALPEEIGPVVIGRSRKGPAFQPITVNSYEEFVATFGHPVPGGDVIDVWREGNLSSPMYGTYAARAYLRNNGPVTFVRTLGIQSDDATATTTQTGAPGWTLPAVGDGESDGGAYGLFIVDSGSVAATGVTGTLAAVWYLQNGGIALSGSAPGNAGDLAQASTCQYLKSVGDQEFKVVITPSGGASEVFRFNFSRTSDKYIRKVFNTSPMASNAEISTDEKSYWLGETYERAVADKISETSQYGVILPLVSGSGASAVYHADQHVEARSSKTGWFIGQDTNAVVSSSAHPDVASGNDLNLANLPKLFRVCGRDLNGEWDQKNIKISISDIRLPIDSSIEPYGSFTLEVREKDDTDLLPKVLETFSNLNLNPNSVNYIARKIGDRYRAWDSTDRRYEEKGDYANASKYIRIEMHENIENGLVPDVLVPFGTIGPLQYRSWISTSGSWHREGTTEDQSGVFIRSSGCVSASSDATAASIDFGGDVHDFKFDFPSIPLRVSSSDAGLSSDHTKAYFGVDLLENGSSKIYEASCDDVVRGPADPFDPHGGEVAALKNSWIFTLDDVVQVGGGDKHAYYLSGSRNSGISVTAMSGTQGLIDAGFDKFTTVLFGGHDGLDITEMDPFRNTILNGAASGYTNSSTSNYARASLRRAIDVVKEPEDLDFNLMVAPGITNSDITDRMIEVCEERGDALAIIDLENDYIPRHEGLPATYPKMPDVTSAITSVKERKFNSSYGCAYYPWVQIHDSSADRLLWAPPSVVALGTMASSAATTELWFAPAGFSRGGLSEGSAGLSVTGVRRKLTSKDRDKLYEVNVNPIASFPAEGIVIFGQKTLQLKKSALDRINTRRMLIHVKKEISRISNSILFDQNTDVTWHRFLDRVEPFLKNIKNNLGLEDYKVILDETTTTDDMKDRNIMYAKIFLKPAKAIEFIALDFIVTRSGASFDD